MHDKLNISKTRLGLKGQLEEQQQHQQQQTDWFSNNKGNCRSLDGREQQADMREQRRCKQALRQALEEERQQHQQQRRIWFSSTTNFE
jgi:hypothetical protein